MTTPAEPLEDERDEVEYDYGVAIDRAWQEYKDSEIEWEGI